MDGRFRVGVMCLVDERDFSLPKSFKYDTCQIAGQRDNVCLTQGSFSWMHVGFCRSRSLSLCSHDMVAHGH